METYVEVPTSFDDDLTVVIENGGTDSESGSAEDEDGNALMQLTQNGRLAQKMAFEVRLPSFRSVGL